MTPALPPSFDRLTRRSRAWKGAAFAYACSLSGIPYAQVRAISNIVERRNREAWQMERGDPQFERYGAEILDHA